VDGCSSPGWGLTDKQDRFVRLIAQGVNNSAACRMVGVNRRTGTRWRLGRTIRNTAGESVQYAPVPSPPPSKLRHPRYLSLEERLAIADMRREKLTVNAIARQLGRSPSTVSRELRRNVDTRGRYFPGVANRLVIGR
jgi:transposase, IS30 family